uniref:BZIP domain-containing protein n=1 Tax=Panagrellus redivivus TaxID=6233 RepID=A0A7E4VBR9_PANRE
MASNGETSQASPSENGFIIEQISSNEVNESTDLVQNLKRKKEALDEPPLKQSRLAEERTQSPENGCSSTSNNTSVDFDDAVHDEGENKINLPEGSESTHQMNGATNGDNSMTPPTAASTPQAIIEIDGAADSTANSPVVSRMPETNGTAEGDGHTETETASSPEATATSSVPETVPEDGLARPSEAPEVPEASDTTNGDASTEVKVDPRLTHTSSAASTSQADAALYPAEALSLEQPDDAIQLADPADSTVKVEATGTAAIPPIRKRKKQKKSAASKAREMKQRYKAMRRQQLQQQQQQETSLAPEEEEGVSLDTVTVDEQSASNQNPSQVQSLQPNEFNNADLGGSQSRGSLSDAGEPDVAEATSSGIPVNKRRKRQKKSVAARTRELKQRNAERNALRRQQMLEERMAAGGDGDGQMDGVLDEGGEDETDYEEGIPEPAEFQLKPRVGRGKYTRGRGRKKSSALKAYEARRKAQAKRLAKWQAQLAAQQQQAGEEQEAAIEGLPEDDLEAVESEVQPGAPVVRQKRKYTRHQYGDAPKRLSKRQIALLESKAEKAHHTELLPPPQKRKYVRRAKPASEAIPSSSGFVLPQPGEPVSTPYMVSPQRIISERRAARREPSVDEDMAIELEQDLENTATRGLPQMQPEPEAVPFEPQQQLEMPPNTLRTDIPPNVPQYITVEAQPEAAAPEVSPYFLPVIEVASDYTSLCQLQRPIMIQPTYCYYVVPAGHHVVGVPSSSVPQNVVVQNPTVDEAPQNEPHTSPPVPKKKNKKAAVVDLTLDSDDEEPTSSLSPNSTTTISSRDRGFTPSMSSRVNSATPSTSSRINGFTGPSSAEPITPPKQKVTQKAQERPMKPVQKEVSGHLNGVSVNSSETASTAMIRSANPTVITSAPPTAAIATPPTAATTAPPTTAPVKPNLAFKITKKPVRTAVQHLEANQNKAFKCAAIREQIRRYRTFVNYNFIHPYYLTHEWISNWVSTMLVVSALHALASN